MAPEVRPRRVTPPRTVEEQIESFIVKDAKGQAIGLAAAYSDAAFREKVLSLAGKSESCGRLPFGGRARQVPSQKADQERSFCVPSDPRWVPPVNRKGPQFRDL